MRLGLMWTAVVGVACGGRIVEGTTADGTRSSSGVSWGVSTTSGTVTWVTNRTSFPGTTIPGTTISPATSTTNGVVDAAVVDSAVPTPTGLCHVLDTDWGLKESPSASVSTQEADRNGSWAGTVSSNFGALLGGECNAGGLLGSPASMCGPDYGNRVAAWAQQFVGCPFPGDAGALSYGLIPPCQSAHTFTTADLALLNEMFLLALQVAATGTDLTGVAASAAGQPLTRDELNAVTARLQSLASAQVAVSSSRYTMSTCAADAATPPPSTTLCAVLDADWGVTESPGASVATQVADRTNSWAGTLALNAGVLGNECLLGGLLGTPPSTTCGVSYGNSLAVWAQQLLGCPVPADGGSLSYGLIPYCQSAHAFTTADLALLNANFLLALQATAAGADLTGNNATMTGQPLTPDQLSAVTTQLQSLANGQATVSSAHYTLSTCAADGG